MGVVATPPLLSHSSSNSHHHPISIIKGLNSLNSMSQSFHPGIYNFSNGFDASLAMHQDQNTQHQSQRHKLLSLRGFEQPAVAPPSLVGIGEEEEEEEEEEEGTGEIPVYETGGMLSEMFNFQSAAAATPAELLDTQIPNNFHRLQRSSAGAGNDWYGSRHGSNNNNSSSNNHHIAHQNHQISSMNADSAAAMQLFLMKPQPRSPSPPPPAAESSSTQLHFLLPNQSTAASPPDLQGFHTGFDSTPIHPPQFTWVPDSSSTGGENTAAQINGRSTKIDGAGESQVQGLSLSLSPLQHLEAAKAEELRMGDGTMLYFNQGAEGGAPSASSFQLKNLESHQQQFQLQGVTQNHHVHVGFSPSLGMVNVLRNSKYLKAAQELLEEFCSVGRGQLRSNRVGRSNNNTNPNSNSTAAVASAGSSSSLKDLPPLSAADRIQYQRRKAALLSILDEVDRRYNHYCSQMQMVVNSFDSIMGYGAARPYTALAQKAMSRHFRCLKDAIGAQLKQTRELLGEKEGVGASGITKGETPKLKFIDQSLRQQRAFHQMGVMEQEAWRPQRGLPERSVNILRAWLFEHFLHPYPSDADKHLLARQTGLSRNQVSNWFINARVRLWKPMVEDMYQQEGKEEDNDDGDPQEEKYSEKNKQGQSSSSAQTTTTTTQPTTTTTAAASKRSEIDALDNDPSVLNAINNNNNNIQRFSENQASGISQSSTAASTINIPITPQSLLNHHHQHHHHHDVSPSSAGSASSLHRFPPAHHHLHQHHQHQQQQQLVSLMEEEARRHGGGGGGGGGNIVMDALAHYGASTAAAVAAANPNIDSSLLMFGSSGAAATGDVSLTLGLRHAGNLPDNNRFPLSDFGSC